jgi:hypothetical protein
VYLAAGVGVVDQLHVGARPAARERHPQRVEHEVGAHVPGELPADDPPAVDVDHEREEHQSFPATQIGEVRDPESVRSRRSEVAPDQVRPPRRARVGDCRAPRLAAALGALNAVRAHQPLDAVAPGVDTLTLKRQPGPAVAVAMVVGAMHPLDLLQQPLIADHPD